MGIFSRLFKRKKKEDQELLRALSSNDEKALELISSKPSREQQVLMLQAGFHEMVTLVQSIRTHMDQQVDLQQKLLASMDHLPSAVEGLSNIGKATEQQTQALGLIRNQLEKAVTQDQQLMNSLGQFNSTLSSMESTNRQSAEMIKTIMARSENRMMKLIGILVVISLALLGTGLYFGLKGFPVISTTDSTEAPWIQQPVVEENVVPEEVTPVDDINAVVPALIKEADDLDSAPDADTPLEASDDTDSSPATEDIDMDAVVAPVDMDEDADGQIDEAAVTDEPVAADRSVETDETLEEALASVQESDVIADDEVDILPPPDGTGELLESAGKSDVEAVLEDLGVKKEVADTVVAVPVEEEDTAEEQSTAPAD